MFSNTKCLDDADNYCTFFRNKAKNSGRSRKNAVMQSNKATCGISRTIVGRLTPMLASYTYTCIAPLGEYISMHVKGCCCLSLYVLDFLLICKSPDYIQLLFFVCKIMLPVHFVTFFILFKYSVDGLMYVTDLTKKTR